MEKNMKKIEFNKPVNILCESYSIREQLGASGEVESVFLEGVAITFQKPTRNRVSYIYDPSSNIHETLIGKPFLDTHNDTSIRTHPPFGHVYEVSFGKHPKNELPCLFYKADIDPAEKEFIRKAKRKDIPGVSIQVLVDEIQEKQDMYGTYVEARIREYLELSGVLIPGDGDSSMQIAEKFGLKKELMPELKDPEEDESPIMEIPTVKPQSPNIPEDKNYIFDVDKATRIGSRHTQVAFKGCNCPKCGKQMLMDRYQNSFQLRCSYCQHSIKREGKIMEIKKEQQADMVQPPMAQPAPAQNSEVPDHDHPEYDQLLIKIQEMENDLADLKVGGIALEKNKKGMKEMISEKDKNDMIEDEKEKKMEERLFEKMKKFFKEELTGMNENPDKKTNMPEQIPMATQPANGVAPSGGEFDSNDKMGDKAGDEAKTKISKPSPDFSKPAVSKNKLELAARYINRAKELLATAGTSEDPTKPKPGKTEEKPDEMEGAKDNSGKTGMKEDLNKISEKIQARLKNSNKEEMDMDKKAIVGMSVGDVKPEEEEMNKSIIKEYLQKSGQSHILQMMSRKD